MSAVPLPHSLHPGLGTARDLLARPGSPPEPALPVCLEPLERLLPEGLHRGELVELVGPEGSGRFSLVLTLLGAATGTGEAAALIDLGDHFDPRDAELHGVRLERLLWLRPCHLKQAFAAAEMASQGGFPLVAFDLGTPPVPGGRGAQSSWLRLQKAARSHRTALLVSSPYRASGAAAATVLAAGRGQGRWSGQSAHPLLRGLRTTLTLRKVRGSRPGAHSALDLRPRHGGVSPEREETDVTVQRTEPRDAPRAASRAAVA